MFHFLDLGRHCSKGTTTKSNYHANGTSIMVRMQSIKQPDSTLMLLAVIMRRLREARRLTFLVIYVVCCKIIQADGGKLFKPCWVLICPQPYSKYLEFLPEVFKILILVTANHFDEFGQAKWSRKTPGRRKEECCTKPNSINATVTTMHHF